MDRITEMQVFAKAVETGNFTSAAQMLSMTQSAVSKTIKRIETRLDTLLLARTSRNIAVTPEGQAYYERVRKVLSALDEAETVLTDLSSESSGVLRLFATESFACHVLAPALPEYKRRYPNIAVDIQVATGALRTLDCDTDLGFYPFSMVDSAMVIRRFMHTRWVICASPAYLAEHGVPKSPADLKDHKCLAYSVSVPCNEWKIWDAEAQELVPFVIKPAISTTHSEMLLSLARAGAGLARLHAAQAADGLASGELVEVLPTPAEAAQNQAVYVVYHSRHQLPQRAAAFLDVVAESLGEQCHWKPSTHAAPAREDGIVVPLRRAG